jgi:hypothetical protein
MKSKIDFLQSLDIDHIKLDSAKATKEFKIIIEELRTIFLPLYKSANHSYIPHHLKTRVNQFAEPYLDSIIELMDAKQGHVESVGKEREEETANMLRSKYNELIRIPNQDNTNLVLLKSNLDLYNEKFDGETNKINNRLEEIIELSDSLKKFDIEKIENKIKEIDTLTNKVTRLYDETAKFGKDIIISKYAKSFEEFARDCEDAAIKWMKYGIGYCIFFILLLTFGFFDVTRELSNIIPDLLFGNESSIPIGTSTYDFAFFSGLMTKLLLLAVAVYLLIFIIKQYIISKNLGVIYRHKSTVLNSYILFRESMGDDSPAMNLILAEVAKTIFSNPQSGYINNGPDDEFNSGINTLLKQILKQGVGNTET